MNAKVVAKLEDVKVHYPVRKSLFSLGPRRFVRAVDGVSLELREGEILGLVGESGCGKSSLGKAVMRLIPPTSGKIEIDGIDFLSLRGRELRKARRHIQMIFQDPYGSLDPRMTVFHILAEPLRAHAQLDFKATAKKIHETLDLVGIPFSATRKYPHEFSGGQRQRINIARALILDPSVIIADEPVSSLDVSVQAQILNLLKEIQSRLKVSMIFISHNLAVVNYIADRIAVMYLGKIVETASTEALYRAPKHPYTQALVAAVPIPDPRIERTRKRVEVRGELPSPLANAMGCAFHNRCPIATEGCVSAAPELKSLGDETWKVSCFEAERAK